MAEKPPNQSKPWQPKPWKRGGKGPKALAGTIDWLTKPLIRKRGFADGTIINSWPQIVGPMLAKFTLPEKIQFPMRERSGGTLHLRVENGAIAMEIQHLEPVIIEKINTHFGFSAIKDIRILQAPLPEKHYQENREYPALKPEEADQLQDSLKNLTDPELKKALEGLGQSVLAKNKKA